MARLARSLAQLREEINALAPNRARGSDGWIGNLAHRRRASRHNPNRAGVVCALDVTNDPVGGCPIHTIAEELRRRPHPNLHYIISNRRIAGRATSWRWHRYTGSNPHTVHAHFAVGLGPDSNPVSPYDSVVAWGLADLAPRPAAPPPPRPTPPSRPAPAEQPTKEQVMALPLLRRGARNQYVRNLQALLIAHGNQLAVDGDFGPNTERVLRAWQGRARLAADGICGPQTWSHLVGVT